MIERINKNEKRLDDINESIKKDLYYLKKYYGSKEWFKDKEAYENNTIPKVKAGVLSEDEVWNTLDDIDDLLILMKKIINSYK